MNKQSDSHSNAPPTLRTIAEMTGLAVTTVSRALNDAPDIGKATKEKVRAVAAQIAYRPNRAGVRLRTGKTNVIALVLSSQKDVIDHATQLVYSISESLRGSSYHLVVMPFAAEADPAEIIRYIVETRSADGVIFNQTMPNDPRVKYLTEHHFPFAAHGRTDMGIEHCYFDWDNAAYARLAVEALVSKGRRHLALVPPPSTQSYSAHTVTGFKDAATAQGLNYHIFDEITSDHEHEEIRDGIVKAVKSGIKIDGLISSSTGSTIAAVEALESLGKQIGQDVDIVSKEVGRLLHVFRPELILVRESTTDAGHFLAKSLVASIDDPDAPLQSYLDVPQASDVLIPS